MGGYGGTTTGTQFYCAATAGSYGGAATGGSMVVRQRQEHMAVQRRMEEQEGMHMDQQQKLTAQQHQPMALPLQYTVRYNRWIDPYLAYGNAGGITRWRKMNYLTTHGSKRAFCLRCSSNAIHLKFLISYDTVTCPMIPHHFRSKYFINCLNSSGLAVVVESVIYSWKLKSFAPARVKGQTSLPIRLNVNFLF